MQDMATLQHAAVTSPNPAPPPQDSTSSNGDEIHQETSRTDKENCDESRPSSGVETNAKDHVIKRDNHIVDLKCQNNNEVTENNGNLASDPTDLSRTNGSTDADGSESEHDDAKSSTASDKMETSQDGDADDRSDSEMKYVCPICDKMLSSQHDFTLHIRSHNNDGVDATEVANLSAKGYSCKICSKVLSSSSSLDRHVLVHSGERPFKCRVCAVAFTTNGNMHRHMRTHSSPKSNDYESDGSSDSGTSLNQNGKSPASPIDNNNVSVKKRRIVNESDKATPDVSPEANNNKRKMDEIVSVDGDPIKRRLKGLGSAQDCCAQQKFQCPVCEREDFASLNVLETHLESTHPDYKIRCRSCDLDFKNHRVLNLHRFMVHHDKETSSSLKASVLGFKDLTFMDFSSEKFPHIARTVCEQKLHQASSAQPNFQCDKCSRAFPCGSALSIHQQACFEGGKKHLAHSVDDDSPTDLSQRTTPSKDRVSSDEEEEEKKREDFFAGLDLQNKSVPTSPTASERREKSNFESAAYFHPEVKDFADIQSMISVTNAGGLRLQDLTKSPVVNGSLTPSDKSYSDANEEEQQDCFAAEFRKMKLKGEFPCRLCASVFPNLRALKGHNRAHLVSGNIFRCNMCPYSNADKAILIRHMRSHNGDRPYECGLCNYAFTTKANCERHLRNRHSKLGRDEVKKSIIYHPSEDPTNDIELQAKIQSVGSDVKRALTFNNSTEDLSQTERYEERYQSRIAQEKIKLCNFERAERFDGYAPGRRSPGVAEAATMTSQNGDDSESDDSGNNSNDDVHQVNRAFNERQRINVRHLYSPNNNSPLDLSMDVLDLSKKATPAPPTPTPLTRSNDLEPQDLSKKTSPPEYNNNIKLLKVPNLEKSHLQAQLMARPQSPSVVPKVDLNVANFYASNPHPMFINNNGFPFPGQPFLNPYFMAQQHPMGLLPELIRGLQMSGGTMLDPMVAADTLQHLHQQAMAEYARKEMKYNEAKVEERPAQEEKVMTNVGKMAKQLVAQPKPRERDNSSVKMVIKNGVLMPKQKQRRYRTERPFFCEHCSARFTLRSNMERHIKQQHPEFWTQRQRGNVAGGRRNPSLSSHSQDNSQNTHESKLEVSCGAKPLSLKIPNHIVTNFSGSFDLPPKSAEDAYETKDKHNMYTNNNNNNINNNNNNNNNKPFISEEVKHAISQQLKSKLNNPPSKPVIDDEEEDDLVIDEEDSKPDDKSVKEAVEDNINKRAEAPKRDASFEEGYKSFKDTFFRGIKSEMKDNVYRPVQQHVDLKGYLQEAKERGQQKELEQRRKEESVDLASVSRLIDNATNHAPAFQRYFRAAQDHDDEAVADEPSDEDEEGLVAPSDNSGSDENRSDVDNSANNKKKSAYSLAPNRVSCPYCHRKFPWSSSLRRHVLTHTGQKPFKCAHCPLLFTTKSNCDRHLLRKHANTSPVSVSPETSPAVAATAPHSSYTMRNVPERPYKCNFCPSSTFSTLSNLNKHLSTKHPNPLAPKVEDVVSNEESCSEEEDEVAEIVPEVKMEVHAAEARDPTSTSDLPFKCHLCEGSYGERQEALEHIKENHPTEFVLLMSKGALENGVEDNNNGHEEVAPGEESLEQLRGKFPDYANRKVMCAFCLRRFWSAEDLRRHMRTHTGERPFSCDICRRRFTLKHSMLRHRKKHSATDASPPSPGNDDDKSDVGVAFKSTVKAQTYNANNFKEYLLKNNASKHQDKILKGYMASQMGKNEVFNHFVDSGVKVNGYLEGQNGKTKTTNHNNNNIMGAPAKGLGSRYIMENPWPAVRDAVEARGKFNDEKREGVEDETDLIGNLLGIQDKSIIDKMLVSKSADDAAKLLGVGNRE